DPATRHPSFPVLDAEGRVLGIVDPPSVIAWRRSGQHRNTTLATLLAGTKPILARPGEYLDEIIPRMNRANIAHIAVADEQDRLQGYIAW
ncbi:CBS domain-containing protein, partial [Klebsiella pneumoniae]|uniref:CBS domain-containing protein n=1 Tax=Klebsiella pneumoniae TaxID=573 RepID=UPI003855170D